MPKRSTTLTGLEIEPTAITAARVDTDGAMRVSTAAYASLEPGVVRDGEVVDAEALSDALRTLFAEHRTLDKRVRVGVANAKVVARIVELPPISDAKELAAAVRYQAQDQLPMPLDAAVIDHHPLGIVDTPDGPRQRVVLVAARRDMVERMLAAVRGAGLRPEGLDLSAFGMVRALAGTGPSDETVVYVSFAGQTNVAIAHGTTVLFTRVIGGGLDGLAVELAERRGLSLDVANGWLTQVGVGETPVDGDEQLVADARLVLEEGIRRTAGEIRSSVDFHHAQGGAGRVARCVLTGAGAAVPGLAEALGVELGLPVTVGQVPVPAGLDAPRLSVAAGLAIEEALAA